MLSRARLFINDEIYVVERDCTFTVFDFPEEKNIIGVSIDLNSVLSDEDAVYRIRLDEPGKLPRTIAQYVLITKLRCKSSKLRFTFSSTAEVIISGDYAIRPLNCELNELGEYVVDLLGGSEAGEFELEFNNEIYTLVVPLKVFKFGFEKQWQVMRPDHLWHSDVKNELYLSIPGATEARVYFHKDDSTYICGQMYEEGKFKIDISDFIPRIVESTSAMVYINIRYLDNRWRKLSLVKVLKRTWLERFSLVCENGEVAIDVEYQGKNQLCARFYQNDSGELISETEVTNGITPLPQLSKDGLYRLEWYEMQSDEFGFDINYVQVGKKLYKYGYIDVSDLSNCKMVIKTILSNEKKLALQYEYEVFDIQKESDNVYFGKLVYWTKPKMEGAKPKQYTLFEKIRFEVFVDDEGNIRVLSLNVIEDDDIFIPYYDNREQVLISENSEVLMKSRDIKRFDPLYEDETTYIVEFRRTR